MGRMGLAHEKGEMNPRAEGIHDDETTFRSGIGGVHADG